MAIRQFERALQLDPAQLDAVYLLGLSDFRLDRYATTVQVLEPILDREKKNLFGCTLSRFPTASFTASRFH